MMPVGGVVALKLLERMDMKKTPRGCSTKAGTTSKRRSRAKREAPAAAVDLACIETVDSVEAARAATGDVQLDLSRREDLHALPAEVRGLANVVALDVSYGGMKRLPAWIGEMKRLVRLRALHTKLRDLPGELAGLLALRELAVGSYELRGVPAVIGKLRLNQLEIATGAFGATDAGRIAANRGLETLSLTLQEVALRRLPAAVGKLSSLRRLTLATWSGSLGRIDGIERLRGLRELALTVAGADSLPAGFTRLRQLERLRLEMPALSALPEDLGKLRALREMEIWRTPLRTLPESIGALAKLAKLSLFEVALAAAPRTLTRLGALEQLTVWDAPLAGLPADLERLKALQRLDIQRCPLAEVPASLWRLPRLEQLTLRETKLAALPAELASLKSLCTLVLWKSPVEALPELIGALPHLRYLNVAETQVARLPDSIGDLLALDTLEASKAPLRELPATLARCRTLSRLGLTGCTFSAAGAAALDVLRAKYPELQVDEPRVESPVAKKGSHGGVPATELSPAVQAELRRLGLASSAKRGRARAVSFPGRRVPLPEPIRRFYDDFRWSRRQFAGTLEGNAVTDLQIGEGVDDLGEHECVHWKPFLPLALTLEFLCHYMIDLDDPDPSDPKVYGLGPGAYRETKPPVQFTKLSLFLATLSSVS
jgi:Leucine-rich repeat (LRR) protein